MEEGSLADWYFPEEAEQGDHGGGEYNSGLAATALTSAESHAGEWSAQMTLPSGEGGTRLFRWRELDEHRELLVSVWLKVPMVYALTADPSNGGFMNVFQFKSRSVSGANDPFWFLNLSDRQRGAMALDLVWWPSSLEGPHLGETGSQRFTQGVATVPIGHWFKLTAHLCQSKDFDGWLRVWQDDQLLFDFTGIRTSFANCDRNWWCASNGWSVNNYSDGLAPAPATIYVDDASIGLAGG